VINYTIHLLCFWELDKIETILGLEDVQKLSGVSERGEKDGDEDPTLSNPEVEKYFCVGRYTQNFF